MTRDLKKVKALKELQCSFNKMADLMPFFITSRKITRYSSSEFNDCPPCSLICINGFTIGGRPLSQAHTEFPRYIDPGDVVQAPDEYFTYYKAIDRLISL